MSQTVSKYLQHSNQKVSCQLLLKWNKLFSLFGDEGFFILTG